MSLLYKILCAGGISTEILLILVVSLRRIARNVPTFLVYTYWTICSDLSSLLVYYHFPRHYFLCYEIQITCDGLLLLVVLFDLARSVLRPLPPAGARGILFLLLLVMLSVGSIIWRISDMWSLYAWLKEWHIAMRLELTLALLRILFLLLIGGLIQFLTKHFIPVGWGERELQIATGIGFYALVSLAGSVVHTYQLSPAASARASDVVSLGYWSCLAYWVICFCRPERRPACEVAPAAPAATLDSNPSAP